ncbi:MAG: hypothetical protein PHO89_09590 [Methylacidiphilaceae bacterium]|nr:hypothetical protein [Candidatus Methylacidiphilaceae bacterium]
MKRLLALLARAFDSWRDRLPEDPNPERVLPDPRLDPEWRKP